MLTYLALFGALALPTPPVQVRPTDCAKLPRGKSYAIVLSTKTPKVRKGTAPQVAVRLVNCSKERLDASASWCEGAPLDTSFLLRITDPAGKQVLPGSYHRLSPGEVYTGCTLVIRRLPPGQEFTEQAYELLWTYKFDRVGEYRIQVFRGLPERFGGGVLKSNVLTITVTK